MDEFYPMPMFINLEVKDLPASVTWYQDALGFRILFSGPPGEPAMAHLRRDRYQDLLLFPAKTSRRGKPGIRVLIQFQAGEISVEEIAAQARSAGTLQVEGPVERPWNVGDVTIHDPDGFRLRFSELLDAGKSFEEVV